MSRYLYSEKSDCKNCYKCIRHCPVKSIRFEGDMAHITQEDCILCGKCYIICPQHAKKIRSDIEIVKDMIKNKNRVIASIAPSAAAYFSDVDFEEIRSGIKKLGFADAEETALGATVVKKCYEDLVKEKKQNVIISSCCPTVNQMIQKYYPEVIPYLANVASPMEVHCSMIKQRDEEVKTVFIGPCISKMAEAENIAEVDCAITFDMLKSWFDEKEIKLKAAYNDTYIRPEKTRARFFPITGGILKTMDCNDKDTTYISIDGIEKCISVIKDIIAGNLSRCFIEMSACSGSCVGGPIMTEYGDTPIKSYISVNRQAGGEDFEIGDFDRLFVKKDRPFISTDRKMPGAAQIREILKKMGKEKPEDELNCGSCGYDTCHEKAIAVYQGKATYEMCLPFLKGKAESFSDNIITNTPNGIIVLNENLQVQQINEAACRIMNIPDPSIVLNEPVVRILSPKSFLDLMEKGEALKEESLYLAEYGKYVEQTIIHDKSYHILICIMHDVTEKATEREKKEKLKRETIETADNVVEKQMCLVQEIASLLGESVAETKIALTKMKESLKYE